MKSCFDEQYAKETTYAQCVLHRPIPEGEARLVSWIPVQFAVKGDFLKLRTPEGKWQDGWEVVGVGSFRLTGVIDVRKQIRGHRRNTGDSLPK